MSTTGLFYDERCLKHETGLAHPERPARLTSVLQGLIESGLWERVNRLDFSPADPEEIARLHAPGYPRRLQRACQEGRCDFDTPDSAICAHSYEVALLSAGGALEAAEAVASGQCDNAFVATRPPGHHAESDQSMGFCLFNNVALAAQRLIEAHGLQRVAIVDFDVHHGNGTQHFFESRSDVLFVSIHEHPWSLYPGTGFEHERGIGQGEGYTLNIPVFPHSGDAVYQTAFNQQVLPKLDWFEPQFLLVSAGFDAASLDPLAHTEVSTEGFIWMTRRLKEAAAKHCQGRLVCVLEGGYHLQSLAAGVVGCVGTLLG